VINRFVRRSPTSHPRSGHRQSPASLTARAVARARRGARDLIRATPSARVFVVVVAEDGPRRAFATVADALVIVAMSRRRARGGVTTKDRTMTTHRSDRDERLGKT
tara:strand:- start:2107 stop:2424 length:318 start_codon:yes stop_codon:yes gene_type:complete